MSLPFGWQELIPGCCPETDEQKMQFVLQLAEWNVRQQTGGPFAAAVFDRTGGELIAIGVNRVVPHSCSLAHAEAVAIALAQQSLRQYDLSSDPRRSFELVASGQPCVQCFGVLWWSGITRLVIGARATDIESLTGFCEGPLPERWTERLAHRDPLPPVEVMQDVCRDDARRILRSYTDSGGTNYSPGLTTQAPAEKQQD
ncbi:MAG: nucleoside deaminase [Planctomycetaceae bacterium]|nr:nucleoside deaminase [Planctomycetaceae bacterium]